LGVKFGIFKKNWRLYGLLHLVNHDTSPGIFVNMTTKSQNFTKCEKISATDIIRKVSFFDGIGSIS